VEPSNHTTVSQLASAPESLARGTSYWLAMQDRDLRQL